MYDAKLAICCVEGCSSNTNNRATECCRACGKCGNDSFHEECGPTSKMREGIVAACSSDLCLNSINGLQVIVCIIDSKCGACSFHEH